MKANNCSICGRKLGFNRNTWWCLNQCNYEDIKDICDECNLSVMYQIENLIFEEGE